MVMNIYLVAWERHICIQNVAGSFCKPSERRFTFNLFKYCCYNI